MTTDLFTIAGLANHAQIFSKRASDLGFGSAGEIDRFVFTVYGKAIKGIRYADRPRGAIFFLEPSSAPGKICDSVSLKPHIIQIQNDNSTIIHSLRIDLAGGLTNVHTCEAADRASLVEGGWTMRVAEQFSAQKTKCVIWATGVGVTVYINGEIYLQSPDVVEELPFGLPSDFQKLSWEDGNIFSVFADSDLNDTSHIGIWKIAKKHLLRPNPESLIRTRLGNFLRFRLAGYHLHDEEAHVENEGRADISLHLIDGRIMIVELKWNGCSLVKDHENATETEIVAAIAANTSGWFTKFDNTTLSSAVKQLVRYYKTGRYHRAYLAIFDCSISAASAISRDIPPPISELDGHSPTNFRILSAPVDPRKASVRSKTS